MLERTATVVWGVARRIEMTPMMWNAFPLHPHVADQQLSNRSHSPKERRSTSWTIGELIDRLRPRRLIAIGNDAGVALADLGFNFEQVRHPSYGGQRDFVEAMERLHNLEKANCSRDLFAA
jgi:hypothetical protein